ncbi:MAG: ABC transporter permease [Desulfovibrio sp.]|nr:MAG: ABC transporter permease [Desulfovibrio sp.]
MRLVKRTDRFKGQALAIPALAVLFAFGAGALILLLFGVNPLSAYWAMAKGAFGSGYLASEVLVKAAPMTLTGLAVALGVTMLLWNIGCEGQLVMGAVFAAGVGLFGSAYLPDWAMLPAAAGAGALGGALWAMGPALLKAGFRVNEILTTLLLNYVAVILMEHLYFGPWRNPQGLGFPGTAAIADSAMLPRFFGTRIHLGLFLALTIALMLGALLRHSKWGFQLRVAGLGPKAARYAAIPVKRRTLEVMAASGALAGLAGMGEICGLQHRLQEGLSIGYGYDGIIVAFLARLNPLAVPVAAVFLSAVTIGAERLQTSLGLPSSIELVLKGCLVFGYLAGEGATRWRLHFGGQTTPAMAAEGGHAE